MDESKEFDAVYTDPAEIKKKQQLETFNEADNATQPEPEKPKTQQEKDKSEWQTFFEKENENYARVVKKKAEHSEFTFPITNNEGVTEETSFTRRKLSVAELRRLNTLQKAHNKIPEGEQNTMYQAEQLASLYEEYANLLLVNTKTNQRMTKTEFEQQDWQEIRAVLDNCILKSIIGSTG